MSLRTYVETLVVKDKICFKYNENVRIEWDKRYFYLNGNSFPTGLAGYGQILQADASVTGLLTWADLPSNGATGLQGATGLHGATGSVGERGFTGGQGVTGLHGITGAQGHTGLQGATGSVGEQGVTGTVSAAMSTDASDIMYYTNGYTGTHLIAQQYVLLPESARVFCEFSGRGRSNPYVNISSYIFSDINGVTGPNLRLVSAKNSETFAIYSECQISTTSTGACTGVVSLYCDIDEGGAGITGVYQIHLGCAALIGGHGDQGFTGVHGVTGLRGQTGAQGVTGLSLGSTGIQGFTGIQGASGVAGPALGSTGAINVNIGSDQYISPGTKAYVTMPFVARFYRWKVLNGATGSISYDVYKSDYTNFPPGVSGSMHIGATGPYSYRQIKNTDTLTNWASPTCAAGDILRVVVTSCTGLQLSTLSMEYSA
jgi:collagen type I/II/III/V/XI/XXIV/XXVII alpha